MHRDMPRAGNPLAAWAAKLGPVERRNRADRISSAALRVQTIPGQQAEHGDKNEIKIQGMAATWSHPFHRRYFAENVQRTGGRKRVSLGGSTVFSRFTFRSAKQYTAYEIPPPDPAMY